MLNIEKTDEGKKLTITLTGRLDTTTSPELETAVRDSIDDIEALVFDLAGLEYISSAGLRVLLSTQKIMNNQGSMVVKNVPDEVMEIFDVTGFSSILTVEV